MMFRRNQEMNDVELLTAGFVTFYCGLILLYDQNALTQEHIALLAIRVGLVILLSRTWRFFTNRLRVKYSMIFFSGIFVVHAEWPKTGMAMEVYGFLGMFPEYLPYVLTMLREIPILGMLIEVPVVRWLISKLYASPKPTWTPRMEVEMKEVETQTDSVETGEVQTQTEPVVIQVVDEPSGNSMETIQ